MIVVAICLGSWREVQEHGYTAREPAIVLDHDILRFQDITSQPAANIPTNPNVFVQQIVCTDDVLAEIETDPAYTVLMSEAVR